MLIEITKDGGLGFFLGMVSRVRETMGQCGRGWVFIRW